MIHASPYQTTLGQHFLIAEQEKEIRTALVQKQEWLKVDDNGQTLQIFPNPSIKKFDHPIPIKLNNDKITYCAIDLSSFVRVTNAGEFTVANRSIYTLQTIRAALTANLINEGPRGIKSLSPNLIKTYSDLITNAVSMAFNVTTEEVLILRTLSAWMYFSMLSEQEEIGTLELQAVIAKLSRDLNIPASFLSRHLDGHVFQDVDEFITVIKEKIENTSIQNLNLAMLYTVIAKNLNSAVWIGLEKQQLLAIAIEHIPTFVSLVVMCLSEQPFKNAGLTKIALRNFKDKAQFILGVNAIVQGR